MSFKALYIPVEGSVEVREYKSFDSLREVVSGTMLQFIPAGEGQMVFNEEAKFEPMPMNVMATAIMNGHLLRGDYIAGVALLVGKPDRFGEPTDVPQYLVDVFGGFRTE